MTLCGDAEAAWIHKLKPALNYQLPIVGRYWEYKVNEKAHTISLCELIKEKEKNKEYGNEI